MNSAGLTDSIASINSSPAECPRCHATSRIGPGICLGCLLESGSEKLENEGPDQLADALADVAVADTHWRLGNYEILEEIGRGGMGVIYRARQRHSRRIVALKRILSYHADSHETLTRFRREAEAAAGLDHPNILPIYEVGQSEDGIPYFSMKYASGGSLDEVGPALRHDPRAIVRLIAKVTRAVQFAHRQGILHRDLKPGNILLDARGEPLVSDFGLAKWLDGSSDLTRTLTVFGTPGFIAPEQAEKPSSSLTPAADVYSLGALLFDLLSGRPPFLGEHALAVIRQAAEKEAPKLRSLVKGANRDLETICARCLDRDPGARYSSAGEVAEDLERWLEGRSIGARPVSVPTKTWRWARRNPAVSGSLAACLILGVAALEWRIQTRRLSATVREETMALHSIAVVPFLDLETARPDPEVTQNVMQSLTALLPRLGPVRITPVPESERFWADTATSEDRNRVRRAVNARTILTGSRRVVEGKTRISIRLLSAANGDPLLTESLVLPRQSPSLAEPLRLLAQPIYSILDARDWTGITIQSHDPGLQDADAREYIISGRQLMFRDSQEDLDRSLRCLEKAVELQPKSAIAHAYLASTAAGRIHFGWNEQLLARAEKEAKHALALEPRLPEAHRALAGVYFQTGNYRDALEEQLRAVETGGPEELVAGFLGMTYGRLGQPVRSLAWLEMARQWTTRPGDYDPNIGDCWAELGEDEKAERAYRRSIELRPEQSTGWVGLAHLRLLEGDFAAARQICQQNYARALRDHPSDTWPEAIAAQIAFFSRDFAEAERLYRKLAAQDQSNGEAFYGEVTYDSALGRIEQAHPAETRSAATLERAREVELRSPFGANTAQVHYRLAALEASLGHPEKAIERFQLAVAAGWSDARSPRLDPRFDAIAQNTRFQQILSTLEARLAGLKQQANQASTGHQPFRPSPRPNESNPNE